MTLQQIFLRQLLSMIHLSIAMHWTAISWLIPWYVGRRWAFHFMQSTAAIGLVLMSALTFGCRSPSSGCIPCTPVTPCSFDQTTADPEPPALSEMLAEFESETMAPSGSRWSTSGGPCSLIHLRSIASQNCSFVMFRWLCGV